MSKQFIVLVRMCPGFGMEWKCVRHWFEGRTFVLGGVIDHATHWI